MVRTRIASVDARCSSHLGPIVYLQVLGRPIVLLNSVQVCNDLFEGRFNIYSDRPHFPLMDL